MPPSSLETPRLRLRRWREADRAPFAAMNADPAVMEFFPKRLSRDESDALVDRIEATFEREDLGLWAVEDRATGAFEGFVGLNPVPGEIPCAPAVEIGWRLRREAWGRGLATEGGRAVLADAFERCGLHRVVSFTSTTNVRSQGVMRALGLAHREEDDFDHPRVEAGPLRRHVLFRLDSISWRVQQLPFLRPAGRADRPFLQPLRRDAYHDLMVASYGRFEEETDRRQEQAQWDGAGLSVLVEGGRDLGVLQLAESDEGIEIREIQIRPDAQNAGHGTRLLRRVAEVAHARGVDVVLRTPLKNAGARRLYERLGFRRTHSDDTHDHLRWSSR